MGAVGGVALSLGHLEPAEFPGQAHRRHGRGGGFQRAVGVGHQEGRHQPGELAARSRDPAHFGAAVADDAALRPVADQINGSGDGNDRFGPLGKVFYELDGLGQGLFRDSVGHVCVHALRRAAAQGQGLDLGDVAPDDGEGQLLHEADGRVRPQGGGPGPYGVQQDGVAQRGGLFARPVHRLDAPLVEGADVQIQAAAEGRDVLHVLRLVGHDGTAAAGQEDVGHIVDGDVIGDVMHQRDRGPHGIETSS